MNRINGFLDSFSEQTGFRQHGGIYSGIARSDMVLQSSGQVSISGTNVSLITGEREIITFIAQSGLGWCAKQPLLNNGGPGNSGLFPIALSGLYTIDMAYQANREIYLRQPYGNLFFHAVGLRPIFVGAGRASLNVSGVLSIPVSDTTAGNFEGDLTMCHHSVLNGPAKFTGSTLNNFIPPTLEAEANARALGVGTLFLNTGSGIANISIGSGIAQFVATAPTFIYANAATYNRVRFLRSIDDMNFILDTGPTGVRIMSPGLYKAYYQLSLGKTASTTIKTVTARCVVYPGTADATITDTSRVLAGSNIYEAVTNTSTNQFGTINSNIIFNADAGSFFGVEVAYSQLAGGTQTAEVNASGTLLIIEKIGPKRGTFM